MIKLNFLRKICSSVYKTPLTIRQEKLILTASKWSHIKARLDAKNIRHPVTI